MKFKVLLEEHTSLFSREVEVEFLASSPEDAEEWVDRNYPPSEEYTVVSTPYLA